MLEASYNAQDSSRTKKNPDQNVNRTEVENIVLEKEAQALKLNNLPSVTQVASEV